MNIEKTCAFTGHRDLEYEIDTEKLKGLISTFIKDGKDTFLCGMARGFDLLAAELVISLKKEYPHIKLIGCIPCLNQDKYFNEEDREKYKRLFSLCDEIKLLNKTYFNGCMQMRDRYMVDNCSIVIACLQHMNGDGGTVYTVKYAERCNKQIYVI